MEAAVQLVLPLLGEAAGADDEAALQIAARDQLLDEQPRHDRLAGAGIVGEQEAQRLPRQHRLVDGGDLVRQRIDERGVDREDRIEQVREADAVRFGDEAEQRAVAVEAPRPALPRRSRGAARRAGRGSRPRPGRSARGTRGSGRPSRATALYR